ncbi:MAG: phosphatase PAP2 family protein [Legionellaceae bacterium]|nr:phosphatase PAP2 family protein [Legionellaceae bacterium]MBP9775663.1 phosphatase PAP2 family protein [Legionellaceae bacterium]
MRQVERWINGATHPVVVPIFLALIVASYLLWDQSLALKMHDLALTQHYPVITWVTQLGKSLYWLAVLPLIALFFRHGHRIKQMEWRIWFLWITLVIANGSCFLLKTLLGRARPELLFSDHIFGFFGYMTNSLYHSFPSGHTTQVTTAVLSLSLLYPKQRWLFLSIGTLILATRVLLTKHYLSDVLATVLLVCFEYRLFLYIVAQQCPLYWKRLGVK